MTVYRWLCEQRNQEEQYGRAKRRLGRLLARTWMPRRRRLGQAAIRMTQEWVKTCAPGGAGGWFFLPHSAEPRTARPSKHELFRWCSQGAVQLNGIAVTLSMLLPDTIDSLVFFPHGQRRTTIV